jgi:hypothetical protein
LLGGLPLFLFEFGEPPQRHAVLAELVLLDKPR